LNNKQGHLLIIWHIENNAGLFIYVKTWKYTARVAITESLRKSYNFLLQYRSTVKCIPWRFMGQMQTELQTLSYCYSGFWP
jgi:hypothetical protein